MSLKVFINTMLIDYVLTTPCFQIFKFIVLAIINNTAVDTCIFVCVSAFLE